MTVTDVLKASHFLVDEAGHRTAAVLDIDDWNRLLAWIEAIIDTRLAESALAELASASGEPRQAGWLDWQSARGEWLDESEPAG